MPIANTSPNTSEFEVSQQFYGGRNMYKARQRVKLTHGADYVFLNARLPARCRVVHAIVSNQTAISVTGGITTVASNLAMCAGLLMFPTTVATNITAPPSTASASHPTGTNGHLLMVGGTSTASGQFGRGAPDVIGGGATGVPAVLPQNTQSIEARLALVPVNTNSNRIYINGTSGFQFGTNTDTSTNTAGLVDVVLYYEMFDDFPNF